MRLLVRSASLALAAIVTVLTTLPWWLGLVLPPVLASHGVTFGTYERSGYQRFALRDIAIAQPGVSVHLARLEADTPLLWLWRYWQHAPRPVTLDGWQLKIGATKPPATTEPPEPRRGLVPFLRELRRREPGLVRLLPELRATSGKIEWSGKEITLASLRWEDTTLRAERIHLGAWTGNATLLLPPDGPLALQADLPAQQTRLTLRADANQATGEIAVAGHTAEFSATFGAAGWFPTEAHMKTGDWAITGAEIGRADLLATASGHAEVAWAADHASADIDLTAIPAASPDLPIRVLLKAGGTTGTCSVDALTIEFPGFHADLAAPVGIDAEGHLATGNASLRFSGELGEIPGGFARGRIEGEAELAGSTMDSGLHFRLHGKDIARGRLHIGEIAAAGSMDWPLLRIEQATLALSAEEQTTIEGSIDLRSHEFVDASIAGTIAPTRLATLAGLPLAGEPLHYSAAIGGPWRAPVHHGRLEAAALRLAAGRPVGLALDWTGHRDTIDSLHLLAQAGTSRIEGAGSIAPDRATIGSFSWMRCDQVLLALTRPCSLTWRPTLAVSEFAAAGTLGSVTGSWSTGRPGPFAVELHDLPAAAAADFVDLGGTGWTLGRLHLAGGRTADRLDLTAAGAITFTVPGLDTCGVDFAVATDQDSLNIEKLDLLSGGAVVGRATGRIPVVPAPALPAGYRFRPEGELALQASAEPSPALLALCERLTGLAFDSPRLEVSLTGTGAAPVGEARFESVRVARPASPALPALESVALQARFDTTSLVLERCSALVNRQPLSLGGELRRPAGGWSALATDPVSGLRQLLAFDLSLPGTDVLQLAPPSLPAVLTQGRIRAELHVRPGQAASGWLRLSHAATRPFGPLGALQDITAELKLEDDRLVLQEVDAILGGQPVRVAGRLDGLWTAAPQIQLSLQGDDLPLVRNAGLLVRSDIDLAFEAGRTARPRISGRLRLRPSLLLVDIRDLAATGDGLPARAPYFRIETEPFRDWNLDVQLEGERFLQVRSPFFEGAVSTKLALRGTLGDPRAIGDVKIAEGRIVMPYASFQVDAGTISLSPDNAADPALSVRGTTRSFGYELQLDVGGTVSAPQVTFSASPSLTADEIVLLLVAGEDPQQRTRRTTAARATELGTYVGRELFNQLLPGSGKARALSIATGEDLSEQGRQTYSLEYQLSDRLSLTAEYDEYDEYNAGIKWRLKSGAPPTRTPAGHAAQ